MSKYHSIPLVLFVCFLASLGMGISTFGCSGDQLSKVGEVCRSGPDCEKGLICKNQRCRKSLRNQQRPEAVAEKSADDAGTDAGSDAGNPDPGTTPDNTTSPDQGTTDNSTSPDTVSTPDNTTPPDPGTIPDNTTSPDNATSPDTPPSPGAKSIYSYLEPQSPNRAKERTSVHVSGAIVTTPVARLSSKLSAFYVQAEKLSSNKDYLYGGMMVVFDRTQLQINYTPGTLLEFKGTFETYRRANWSKTCTVDSDCAAEKSFTSCVSIYDKKNAKVVQRCGEPAGMPQVNLSEMPKTRGNRPMPAPIKVKPVDVRAGFQVVAYLGLLLELSNVQVENPNPDGPKFDYQEFSVVTPTDTQNDLRVDDFFDTASYTGSKYCGGCTSKPPSPDKSYCIGADVCNCIKDPKTKRTTGRCYTGQADPDIRKKGDRFASLKGVLSYSFGFYKLLPRTINDMKRQ